MRLVLLTNSIWQEFLTGFSGEGFLVAAKLQEGWVAWFPSLTRRVTKDLTHWFTKGLCAELRKVWFPLC